MPSRGAEDWRALLADPDGHWKPNRSAWSLAHHWESAGRLLPTDVAAALPTARDTRLANAEMLLAIPEHQTALPGGGLPSQSDLFVLLRSYEGLVSMVVEAKVTEPFGPDVAEWLAGAPELARKSTDGAPPQETNRQRRLAGLLEVLSLGPSLPHGGLPAAAPRSSGGAGGSPLQCGGGGHAGTVVRSEQRLVRRLRRLLRALRHRGTAKHDEHGGSRRGRSAPDRRVDLERLPHRPAAKLTPRRHPPDVWPTGAAPRF